MKFTQPLKMMLRLFLPIHVYPTHVDCTQIAKAITITRRAAVCHHTSDRLPIVVQNAQLIMSALAIKLAYGSVARTHVRDRAELILSVMSTITVPSALA